MCEHTMANESVIFANGFFCWLPLRLERPNSLAPVSSIDVDFRNVNCTLKCFELFPLGGFCSRRVSVPMLVMPAGRGLLSRRAVVCGEWSGEKCGLSAPEHCKAKSLKCVTSRSKVKCVTRLDTDIPTYEVLCGPFSISSTIIVQSST